MRNMVHNTWRMWMLNDRSEHIAVEFDKKLVFGIRGENAEHAQGAIDSYAGHTGFTKLGEPETPEQAALREFSEEYFGVRDLNEEEGKFIRDAYANGNLQLIQVGKLNGFANMRKLIAKEDGTIEVVPMGKENAEDWEQKGTVLSVPFEPADLFLAKITQELVGRAAQKSVSDMAGGSFQAKTFQEWKTLANNGAIQLGPSAKKLLGLDQTLDINMLSALKNNLQKVSSPLKEIKGKIETDISVKNMISKLEEMGDTKEQKTNPLWVQGGINLNPASLDLQIKRDANWVPLLLDQQPILNMKIDGFSPVIINITPVNVPLLLGLNDTVDPDCPSNANGAVNCTDGAMPINKPEEVLL